MARFGSLMLNEGTWNETVVLGDPAYFSAMTNTSQDLNKSYGYLWWLNGKESFKLPQTDFVFSGGLLDDAPSDMYAAIGKNGQYLNIVPSQNLLVIRMGENPSDEDALVPTVFNNKIWQYLNDLMCEDANVAEYNPTKESTVYPNPFTDVLNIQANEYEYYKVIDITGKEVQNGTLSKGNNLIDTQALKQGVYYLQINNENGSRIEKIIRQ
jgi:CubicO group peptidase (beta-lactamase class C family)